MKKITLNSTLFKTVDRISAVLSSLSTAVFVALLIYVVLLEKMGEHRTLAILCKHFPSRELMSVSVLLISLAVTGIIAMLCYNFDMLSGILVADGVLKTAGIVFLLVFTKISLLYIALSLCVIYLLVSLMRAFGEPAEALEDDEAEEEA